MDPHDLYRRWLTELWGGELAAADELVAEDFVGHWPDREVRGRAELVQTIRQTREMFTEISFELELGPIVEGDLVAARWTGTGRGDGGSMEFFGNDLLRVRDGRIAEYWVASASRA